MASSSWAARWIIRTCATGGSDGPQGLFTGKWTAQKDLGDVLSGGNIERDSPGNVLALWQITNSELIIDRSEVRIKVSSILGARTEIERTYGDAASYAIRTTSATTRDVLRSRWP